MKTEVVAGDEGLFDVIGSVIVKDEDLSDSEEFVCEMRVPQANYTARKQTMYYPGKLNVNDLYLTQYNIVRGFLLKNNKN